ncbi:DUF3108 domain-containing protein [Methylotenera mobilis]|uniref:DUF3108 domain-containing protein n=1 Tax=Methylotenera mobilis (strain JLW8 / ATCC BAA-1282 / DSM 17540) TaxID=583345 RepID=C6WTA8_METML|nr:DUF3108 domain-containing protein [Methylotenera mobilis]ACT49170.1 hypothetical protein Mmol_2268 [Methylotenera mobilis JLW8]
MFHTLTSHAKAHKTFIAAVMVSLLLHTLFLSEFSFTLPEITNNQQQLNVRLTPTPAPVMVKKILEKSASKPKQKKPENSNTESSKPTDSISTTPTEDKVYLPATDDAPVPPVNTEPEAASLDDAVMPSEPSMSETEVAVTPPQYIETEFEVFQGDSKSAVGNARITFNIDMAGSYAIKSTIEAQGLTALFFQNLVQESQGVVTEQGLKPSYYSYRYGNKKSQTAKFHWDDSTLTMRTEKGEKTEKLEAGTQDLLSFIYQFMFTPPLVSNAINITNGKTLRNYNYRFEGEEIIYSKLGALNTIHLIRANANSEEKTELWLATDYKNLPIKIRKTEKNGSVIEQVISSLNTTPALKPQEPDVTW